MKKPYVICHMLTSLDGKIDGAFFGAPESEAALAEYGNIRRYYECEATLYGTTTMAGSYSAGLAGEIPPSGRHYSKKDFVAPSNVKNYIVSVDPDGILGWDSGYIEKKGRPRAHVIEVLTAKVPENYLAYLHKNQISYIFAGPKQLDCRLLMDKLEKLFGIKRLMIAGGGQMNWSFAQAGLIDELSIVIAPVADGSTTAVSIFEQSAFLKTNAPVAFELGEVKKLDGNALWLRYMAKGHSMKPEVYTDEQNETS